MARRGLRHRYKFTWQERWGDTCYNNGWPEYTYSLLPDWPLRVACFFRGHIVMDDQCGIPSHRFCAMCGKGTPDAPVDPSW